jgi:hypothetical protein
MSVPATYTRISDVLRRRFQINTMSGMGYQYKGIFDAVRVITAQEGIRGLYKGISPNLLKVAPSMASSWLSFEMTRDYFISLRPEEAEDEIWVALQFRWKGTETSQQHKSNNERPYGRTLHIKAWTTSSITASALQHFAFTGFGQEFPGNQDIM